MGGSNGEWTGSKAVLQGLAWVLGGEGIFFTPCQGCNFPLLLLKFRTVRKGN